jgi:surfeit locus 1 family protein
MISIGSFVFKPALVPSIAALLLLPLLLALGFWQLDRARQKDIMRANFETRVSLPALPIDTLDLADPEIRYRRISATGYYDGERQILLDNQILAGRPGYHVYTPFRYEPGQPALLVNRGWIAVGGYRDQLPDVSIPDATEVALTGRVGQPANPGLRLAARDGDSNTWPRVTAYIDYDELSRTLGYPLAPVVILLAPAEPYGYRREWNARFAHVSPARHRGYAVQWFGLAVTLVVIYIVVNVRRRHCPMI